MWHEAGASKMEKQDMETLERMQHLSDVPITVQVELDRKFMSFGELLDMDAGSLIKLSRPTGENIDVYAGGVLIGWGEVLLIDGNMAVRIADLKDGAGAQE